MPRLCCSNQVVGREMVEIEIAICTHNRAKELDLCLTTLARQKAPQETWRVLVIDNASTDETPDIVERHRLRGLLPGLRSVFEKRPGLTAARQCAISETKATYVAFVDDDCHLAPDWIDQLLAAIARYPDAAAFGGCVKPSWRTDIAKELRAHGWIFAEQPHGRHCEEGNIDSLVGAGVVLNRAALIATGWVDEPLLEDRIGLGANSGGDVEISLRLRASGGHLVYIPSMKLDHMIDPARQTLSSLLKLSKGLGAGAALVSLLQTESSPEEFLCESWRESRQKQRKLVTGLMRCHYSISEWRIYWAFECGRIESLKRLHSDDVLVKKLSQKLAGS